MTNTNELNKVIKESGLRKEKIANELGISLSSLNNKIANRTSFYVDEIEILKRTLKLNEKQFTSIFFAPRVSSYDTLKGAVNG